MTTKAPKQLEWRLAVMMAERGIRTATELHRQLIEYGIDISSDRVSRVVSQKPERLNLDLLACLATVLNCNTDDLLRLSSQELLLNPSNNERSGSITPKPPKAVKTKATKQAPDLPQGVSNFDTIVGTMLDTKMHAIPLKKRD